MLHMALKLEKFCGVKPISDSQAEERFNNGRCNNLKSTNHRYVWVISLFVQFTFQKWFNGFSVCIHFMQGTDVRNIFISFLNLILTRNNWKSFLLNSGKFCKVPWGHLHYISPGIREKRCALMALNIGFSWQIECIFLINLIKYYPTYKFTSKPLQWQLSFEACLHVNIYYIYTNFSSLFIIKGRFFLKKIIYGLM